jgi:hypothetical protein
MPCECVQASANSLIKVSMVASILAVICSPDTRPMLELVTEDAKALDPQLLRDLYIAFNGRNHRQLPYGAKELRNEHSSATAFTHICQTSATGSVHPHSSVCDGQL